MVQPYPSKGRPFKPSLPFLVLEIVGTIVLGLGVAETFAKTNLVPPQWRFEHYGAYIIAVGCLLNLPHLIMVIKNSRIHKGNPS